MSWLGLIGKRAVVTGGGSGIGRSIAEEMIKAGMIVTILDRNPDAVKRVVEELKGGDISGRAIDVSSSAQVTAFWNELGQGVSVLVNSAGITRDNFLLRMDEAAFDDVLSVNLKGTFLMTQAFGRNWTADGSAEWRGNLNASVVNISSMVGKMGNLGQANYAASKAGVIGFTKTVAKELARDSIRVNAILPGFISTPMTAAVPEKVLSRIIPTIPAGRMGQPLDIANAALFLASDRSLYMTGGALEVAGGLSM